MDYTFSSKIRQCLTVIAVIILSVIPSFDHVLAQTATDLPVDQESEIIEDTASPTEGDIPDIPPPTVSKPYKIDEMGAIFDTQPRLIRPRPAVRPLAKQVYQASEGIIVQLGPYTPALEALEVELIDSTGLEVDADMEKQEYGNESLLSITPPAHIRPGNYTLRISDADGIVSEQDFSWGVLALNTNKATYRPQDTAKIYMAVLDETGNMVCDAKVQLSITDPEGKLLEHSTDEESIKVGQMCPEKVFTMEPDFEARYSIKDVEGRYRMMLSAKTRNGVYTIEDEFYVFADAPFDVEREANTRIFPPLRYPVLVSIVANQDFKGEISEVVPKSFDIGKIENLPAFTIADSPAETAQVADEISLGPPFVGEYQAGHSFGTEETDPLLAEKYRSYKVTGHDGADFAMPIGTSVQSVDEGIVARAEVDGDYGTTLVIQHEWGRSYYGHLSKILVKEGDIVERSQRVALSGDTGISTEPRLHFGMKLEENDPENGYYGKINPQPYLEQSAEEPALTQISRSTVDSRVLSWMVDVKKGERIQIGYSYLAPNKSPQFYTLGPLEFVENADSSLPPEVVYREARQWQIAVDADGSGTNTVNPTTGSPSTTGNTYTFTYTPSENIDSGQIQVQVPSSGSPDWSAPQGTAGTAGYTTAVGNTNATVANVLNNNNALTGWSEDDIDTCNSSLSNDMVLDTSAFKESTGSIRCDNAPSSAGPDSTDSFGFDYGSNQNWATACNGGACTQVGYWIMRTGGSSGTNAEFAWSSGTDLQATRIGACAVPATPSSGVWVYAKCTLSGTLTTIRSYGFICTNATCNPFETADVNIDELLIGPGVPTFSGRNINVRLLDATTGDTVTVTYGSGGGASGVTNSSTEAVHTFTTLSKISVTGTLTNISSHPTVTISSGPTLDQLMRHGKWFNGGSEQPFTF